MTNVLGFVPISGSGVSGTTRFQPNESKKHQLQQLVSQFISGTHFWQIENKTGPNLAILAENWKTDKLQEELESLKLFGAGIAHDLGNVFTVIIANLELLKLTQEENELEQIYQELEIASNMAKALHEQLTALFQGNTFIKQTVCLAELLKEASRLGLYGSGIECHFKLAPNLPPLQVDKTQINQVVTNLALNAAQAMPNGGQLVIEAESVKLTEDNAFGLSAGKYVQIKVRDNGMGIPSEQLKTIFAPYFTTKAKGHGLGLALCYLIIQRHQGHISVESQVGVGTTFRLLLPVN